MNALEVEHLGVRLGGAEILRDLSFHVAAGDALAVIGPNASGKTVLFRALIGAVPHTGTIRWAPRTRLGYVPQKLDIERDVPITAHDLLRAGARTAGARAADVARTVARVGLAPAALALPIGTLSGGQFQRLLVAFALVGRPTVLLLDEPTAGVDEPGQERLHDTVRRLQAEDGVTVLLVSHDLTLVHRAATHVLCLARDQVCFGAPRAVLTPAVLERLYGAPVGLHLHDGPDGPVG